VHAAESEPLGEIRRVAAFASAAAVAETSSALAMASLRARRTPRFRAGAIAVTRETAPAAYDIGTSRKVCVFEGL
jgi:hypothetical protein